MGPYRRRAEVTLEDAPPPDRWRGRFAHAPDAADVENPVVDDLPVRPLERERFLLTIAWMMAAIGVVFIAVLSLRHLLG